MLSYCARGGLQAKSTLGALTALGGDMGLVPTPIAAPNHLVTPVLRNLMPSSGLHMHCTYMGHIYTHR